MAFLNSNPGRGVKPTGELPKIDAKAIAEEFLDQWDEAHPEDEDFRPDYGRLKTKFAVFTGAVSLGEAEAVRIELHEGRKARGWPDPTPGTIDPGIDGAIMMVWLMGLRELREA